MPKLKQLAQVREIAKNASAGQVFILIPKDSIMPGRTPDGHLILNKNADVSNDIRKEDMDGAGYDQDMTDGMGGDDNGAMDKEEAKMHAENLDKCRGAIMKSVGLTEDDMQDDGENIDGGHGEPMAGEEMGKGRGARRRTGSNDITKSIGAMLDKRLGDFMTAVDAKLASSGAAPLQARKDGEGTVQKRADEIAPGGQGGDYLSREKAKLDGLLAERSALIEKKTGGIKFTDQESIRAAKLGELIPFQQELVRGIATGNIREPANA